jgi:hypothetical protein
MLPKSQRILPDYPRKTGLSRMMSGFSAARKLDCRPDNFLFAVSNFLKNGVSGNFPSPGLRTGNLPENQIFQTIRRNGLVGGVTDYSEKPSCQDSSLTGSRVTFVAERSSKRSMPTQTVTRSAESDLEPATLYTVLAEVRNIPKWAPVFADAIDRTKEYYLFVAMFYGSSVSRLRQLVPVECFHRGWSVVPPSQETHSASSGSLRCNGDLRELNRAPLRH